MRIFLLGATGQTGSRLLKDALMRGHQVTAYVRSPEKVFLVNKGLNIIKGDLFSVEDMDPIMAEHDVVISCLGGNDKTTVITELTKTIVSSMKMNHIKKIVSISSAGIHDEFSFITNVIVKLFYKHVINDHKLAAQIIMSSDLEYTLARPLSLTEGELTKHYRITSKGVPKGGKEISRQDLAHFLLNVTENNDHINETIGLAY